MLTAELEKDPKTIYCFFFLSFSRTRLKKEEKKKLKYTITKPRLIVRKGGTPRLEERQRATSLPRMISSEKLFDFQFCR